MNNRFKNYGLWVSIFALIGFCLGNWGLYDAIGLNSESYQQLVDLILMVLVAAGIISNPKEGKMYKDEKVETPKRIDPKGQITNKLK